MTLMILSVHQSQSSTGEIWFPPLEPYSFGISSVQLPVRYQNFIYAGPIFTKPTI